MRPPRKERAQQPPLPRIQSTFTFSAGRVSRSEVDQEELWGFEAGIAPASLCGEGFESGV